MANLAKRIAIALGAALFRLTPKPLLPPPPPEQSDVRMQDTFSVHVRPLRSDFSSLDEYLQFSRSPVETITQLFLTQEQTQEHIQEEKEAYEISIRILPLFAIGLLLIAVVIRAKMRKTKRTHALINFEKMIYSWVDSLSTTEVTEYLNYNKKEATLDLIPPSPDAFERCIKTMRNECELWVIKNKKVLPKKTVDEINKFIQYTKEDVDKVDHLSIKRSLRSLEEALFESADFFEVAKEGLLKPAVLLALIKLLLDVATM